MAIETLYADAHLTGTFPNPTNAIGNTPTTWAGDLNTNANYTSRWSLADPVSPLTSGSTQTVNVLARKGSNSGTPTIAINLYIAGALVASRTAQNVTSTTGQVLTVTFTVSDMSPPVDAEIELVETGQGGSGSARNSAQVAYIEWQADTTPIVPQTFVANLLTATAALHTPGVLPEQLVGADLLGTSAAVFSPAASVGPVTVAADLLNTSPAVHPAGVQPGAVAFAALLIAAPATVHTPGAVATYAVVADLLTAGVNVISPGTLLAVDITVVVPHIYV